MCPVSDLKYANSAAIPTGYALCTAGTANIAFTAAAGGGAINNNAYCTWGGNLHTTYLVDLWVEMGLGAFPCIDMYAHPAPVGITTTGTIYDLLA